MHIFNQSISINIFPESWKTSLVSPLFKEGSRNDPNNYRPISLLSLISKLLERIVHDQIYSYYRQVDFFCDNQLGFRKGHSTSSCLIDLLDGIYNDVDNGAACGVLFLDL